MKIIELTILDVKLGGGYISNRNCPLATAIKRQFPKNKEILVGATIVKIDDIYYNLIPNYMGDDYSEDILNLGDNDKEVLRTFELIERKFGL